MINILKSKFIISFLLLQLFLVFFEIHRQSQIIKFSYKNQKLTKYKSELLLKQQKLNQAISSEKKLSKIKEFAINNLGMQKIQLNKLKTLGE